MVVITNKNWPNQPNIIGYVTTICKAQGQTLDKAVVWFDIDNIPPGTAYVALSRMYSAKKQIKSNEPVSHAVNYFRHFPTNFLKPYGMADEAPSQEVVMRRLSSINCELLRRPQTGVSEFAETIEKNLNSSVKIILLMSSKVASRPSKITFVYFTDLVKKLNTKNADQEPATPDDMKLFLKAMLTENEAVDKFFQDMMKFGGAMNLLGTHYTVIKTLLNNPDAYASKGHETFYPEMTEFKANPTVKGMRTLLTETCTTSAAVTHHGVKRNLAAMLESDDEEEEQQTPPAAPAPAPEKPKGKKHKKSKKNH
ncbi:Hypothetical predicted protein [Paramuricea clavata]|uniref:Uncharacterized protein n=1 Tax=Paramuricea clavata TaxID=317549 RepID=A0A7D9HEY5_PARCT|nr:Hypothetical predicted protein [Paramuricea clavata]